MRNIILLIFTESQVDSHYWLFSEGANNFGTFLGGCAAVLGVYYGGKKFNEYLKKKQYEATIGFLITLKEGIGFIVEIIGKPNLFEHEGYYPGNFPEKRNENLKPYWERPNRLLYNQVSSTVKNLNSFVVHIEENKVNELICEIEKFQQIGRELGGFLQARTDTADSEAPKYDPKMQSQNYKTVMEYRNDLNQIYERTKKILHSTVKQ